MPGNLVAGVAVVSEGKGEVTMYAGARKLTSRAGLLPRGPRRVERIETSARRPSLAASTP